MVFYYYYFMWIFFLEICIYCFLVGELYLSEILVPDYTFTKYELSQLSKYLILLFFLLVCVLVGG